MTVSADFGPHEIPDRLEAPVEFRSERPLANRKDSVGDDSMPPAGSRQFPTGKEVSERPGQIGGDAQVIDTEEMLQLLRRLAR